MAKELTAFKCNECDHIWVDPYDESDRFSEIPNCVDCSSNQVEIFDGELPDDVRESLQEFMEEDE